MFFSVAVRTKSLTCLTVKICGGGGGSISAGCRVFVRTAAASWQAVVQSLCPHPLLYLHSLLHHFSTPGIGCPLLWLSAGEVMQLLVFQAEPAVRVGCLRLELLPCVLGGRRLKAPSLGSVLAAPHSCLPRRCAGGSA